MALFFIFSDVDLFFVSNYKFSCKVEVREDTSWNNPCFFFCWFVSSFRLLGWTQIHYSPLELSWCLLIQERRREYDARLAEEVQLEGAWGELASLLTRLQEKLDEAANTIRCTNCNKRHRRVKLPRPIYAARHCTECQIHHAAREVRAMSSCF